MSGDKSMSRKEFMSSVGKVCICSCACAVATSLGSVYAQETTNQAAPPAPEQEPKPRSQERIEFIEKWAVRFFDVLDANLDMPARKKIMMANGKACLLAWQKETSQSPRSEPLTLERFTTWAKEHGSPDYEVDGNVIWFQYVAAAETGKPSPENHCLCPMVETNPPGLSGTFCDCSLGYVKEMHEQMFKRPVDVELVSSVLKGDPRCKFKITVS